MVMYRMLLLLTLCMNIPVWGAGPYAYSYPVGIRHQDSTIVLVQQTHDKRLEVWSYSLRSKKTALLTDSRCNPTQVALLPDETGFSFIDNGAIKIKEFTYRSERRIEPDIPIHSPYLSKWLTPEWCMLSAVYGHYSGIFALRCDGVVLPFLVSKHAHFTYPCSLGADIFAICQDSITGSYAVIVTRQTEHEKDMLAGRLSPDLLNFSDDAVKKVVGGERLSTLIYDFGSLPIAFLRMQSETMGYVLSHRTTMAGGSEKVLCECYQLSCTATRPVWHAKKLFSFSIPSRFFDLNHPDGIYERMLPLVPCYLEDRIYYIDYDERTNSLLPFVYQLTTGERHIMPIMGEFEGVGGQRVSPRWICLGNVDGVVKVEVFT
jgi:hypothetical protein